MVTVGYTIIDVYVMAVVMANKPSSSSSSLKKISVEARCQL